jgi:hypothetical protein
MKQDNFVINYNIGSIENVTLVHSMIKKQTQEYRGDLIALSR